MFQAIVHAPCLRPGARLCVSDLEQTAIPLAAGDRLALRYGACCPDLGSGAIAAIEADTAILVAAHDRWRICRCPERSGIDLPGLVAENWIVIGRDG